MLYSGIEFNEMGSWWTHNHVIMARVRYYLGCLRSRVSILVLVRTLIKISKNRDRIPFYDLRRDELEGSMSRQVECGSCWRDGIVLVIALLLLFNGHLAIRNNNSPSTTLIYRFGNICGVRPHLPVTVWFTTASGAACTPSTLDRTFRGL